MNNLNPLIIIVSCMMTFNCCYGSLFSKHYISLGSCSCDLTSSTCDNYCCCDPDCRIFGDHLPFACEEESRPTAAFDPSPFCTEISSLSPDYSPFLCIQSQYSTFLGHIFPKPNAARTAKDFQTLTKNSHTDHHTLNPDIDYSSSLDEYIFNSKLVLNNKYHRFLNFPTAMSMGKCNFLSPMRFLQDQTSTCTYVNPTSDCGSGIFLPIAPEFYSFLGVNALLETPISSKLVPVNITYRCPPGPVENDPSQRYPCGFGKNFPKLGLSVNPSLNYCSNAVINAEYTVFWEGTKIVQLNISLDIANMIPPIIQKFALSFKHVRENGRQRSGVVGYRLFKPVLTLSEVDSKPDVITFKAWSPIQDGFCHEARTTDVLFGEDITSGCIWTVEDHEFSDCDSLRENIARKQLRLFKRDSISVSGNLTLNNVNTTEDLVTVLVNIKNETETSDVSWTEIDGPGRCSRIPNGIHLRILYSNMGYLDGDPVYKIIGSQYSFSYDVWEMDPAFVDGKTVFPVTSHVRFVQVPAQRNTKVKRFWIYEQDVCYQDTCWHELWYPGVSIVSPTQMATCTVITFILIIPGLYILITQLKYA